MMMMRRRRLHYISTNELRTLIVKKSQICNTAFTRVGYGTSSSSRKSQPCSDFATSFLQNQCGLSGKTLDRVSILLNSKSIDKRPHLVLQLFKSYKFSQSNITNIISRRPYILTYDPQKTLKPKLDFLLSVCNDSHQDVVKIVSTAPRILEASLKNHIIPFLQLLSTAFGNYQNAVIAVKCKPFLLFCKASSVAANMNLLQAVGVPQTLIFQIMKQIHAPTCNDVFSSAVLKVKDMGFDPKSWSFVHALIAMIFCNNDLLRGTKADMYRSFGFSDDDMLFMFKKQPLSFTFNAVRNMKGVDFCLNKLCWSPSQLAASPNVLLYSLEKRTIPRCSVLQVLVSRNMVTKSFSLLSVLCMTEAKFLKEYVLKHQKEVPEVVDAYQGKIKFDVYNFSCSSRAENKDKAAC